MDTQHRRDYWPTDGWQTVSPQDMHIDPVMLSHMQKYIETELPGLHSLLIVRQGYLTFEAYYQGFHQNSYNNVASVTKSLVSPTGCATRFTSSVTDWRASIIAPLFPGS